MTDTEKCKQCYKELSKCKCTLDKMNDEGGFCSSSSFGEPTIQYNYLKMDGKLVLKLKLLNDYIYLGVSGIDFLNNITKRYKDIQHSVYQKQLMNWECNSCGKKTNNMQEWCDDCISNGDPCD